MAVREVFAGDDIAVALTLYEADADNVLTAISISGGATVTGIITDRNQKNALSAQVTLDDDHDDSDWDNGVVVFEMPAATSGAMTVDGRQRGNLQITVDDGGVTTWTFPVLVVERHTS